MIDQFADATDDHQFIHVDPERAAAETPFGGTIAHGFLSLSLLSAMTFETVPPLEGAGMGINHGFDTVRFVAPVKTGASIRARFFLADVEGATVRLDPGHQRRHHRDREFDEAGADGALADADLRRAEGRHDGRSERARRRRARPLSRSRDCRAFPVFASIEKFKSGQSNPTYLLDCRQAAAMCCAPSRRGSC